MARSSLFLVFLALVFYAQAIILKENFNPALANPLYAITCQGPLPGWRLPMIMDWDPNQSTLQEVCAKPQYGGKPVGDFGPLGLSGFCLPNLPGTRDRGFGIVAFDRNEVYIQVPTERRPVTLFNPRLLLFCRERCYCTEPNGVARATKPKGFHSHNAPLRSRQLGNYVVHLDVFDDFSIPIIDHLGTLYNRLPTALITWAHQRLVQYFLAEGRPFGFDTTEVTVDPENSIECLAVTDVPEFPIPEPYSWTDFDSPRNICANAFSGGNPGANAGGYCHRTVLQDRVEKEVFFSDEVTPRLEWTWDSLDFAARVRYWCFQRCWCTGMPRPHPASSRTLGLWQFLANADIVERFDIHYIVAKNTDGSKTILPLDSGSSSSGGRVVQKTWPTDVLGPKPLAPPVRGVQQSNPYGLTSIAAIQSHTLNAALGESLQQDSFTCGGRCFGVGKSGCSAGAKNGCICAIPAIELSSLMGWTHNGRVAICIYAAQLVGHVIKHQTQRPGLGGRSLEPALDLSWTCPCNSTYISKACCESEDGVIWEDLALRKF